MNFGPVTSNHGNRKEAYDVFTAILDASLTSGAVPITVGILCAIVLVAVLLRRRGRRWIAIYLAAAATGAGLGFALAWYLGDVQNDFEITLAFSTRAWFALGCAGAAVALVSLWRARPLRIVACVMPMPSCFAPL